jgi:hypothetical protein
MELFSMEFALETQVIPANAGNHFPFWIPAFAGMTARASTFPLKMTSVFT